MDDAVARYRAASEANDVDGVMATFVPDVELVSPLSSRMVFRGHDDVRILHTAILGSVTGLRWRQEVGDSTVRVVMGDAMVGPLELGDAVVLELAEDGRIRRVRPHLRPWLAVTLFAVKLGSKLGRHPAAVRRAWRRA